MIIRFPTGLYSGVLPKNPGDGGNVTFTISNSPPPRANLLFPKVPNGLVIKGRTPINTDAVVRRAQFGGLIFTITAASRTVSGNNQRQFEIGQVLEFTSVPDNAVEPMLVADSTEIRHDTNQFDYSALGLSTDEQQLLQNAALQTQATLTARLNALRELRANSEQNINTTQKTINDLMRNVAALEVIVANAPDVQTLIDKFNAQLIAAGASLGQLVIQANAYAAEADTVMDQLRSVASVTK